MTVSRLRAEMIERFDAVDRRSDALEDSVASLRAELKAGMAAMRAEMAAMRAELRGHMDVLYESLRDDIRLLAEGRPAPPKSGKPS